jgi:hypothetical protein
LAVLYFWWFCIKYFLLSKGLKRPSAQVSPRGNHSHLVVLPESEEAGEMRIMADAASRNCELHIGVPADFIGTAIELKSSTEMAERLAQWRR